jgi:fimbrial chaperone protein
MRRTTVLVALVSLGCILSGRTLAASLEFSPLFVNLAPGQTTATVEVTNRGGAPAAVQARAFRWTQAGDADTLIPTNDIILSPPIFTVPDGAAQTIRLLLRGGPGAGGERSYRLLLDEVPPANAAKRQVVMAMRVSLPVIVEPAGVPPVTLQTLQWRAEHGPDGRTVLTATNTGAAYDKVNAIAVTLADGSHPKLLAGAANAYVLPGAQRHWSLEGRSAGGPLQLSVTSQAGKRELTLTP